MLFKTLLFYLDESTSIIASLASNKSCLEQNISMIITYSEAIVQMSSDFLNENVFSSKTLVLHAIEHPMAFKMLLQDAMKYYSRILDIVSKDNNINYLKLPT